jgi:hypothetical protein
MSASDDSAMNEFAEGNSSDEGGGAMDDDELAALGVDLFKGETTEEVRLFFSAPSPPCWDDCLLALRLSDSFILSKQIGHDQFFEYVIVFDNVSPPKVKNKDTGEEVCLKCVVFFTNLFGRAAHRRSLRFPDVRKKELQVIQALEGNRPGAKDRRAADPRVRADLLQEGCAGQAKGLPSDHRDQEASDAPS